MLDFYHLLIPALLKLHARTRNLRRWTPFQSNSELRVRLHLRGQWFKLCGKGLRRIACEAACRRVLTIRKVTGSRGAGNSCYWRRHFEVSLILLPSRLFLAISF